MGYKILRSPSPEAFFIALAIRLLQKSNTVIGWQNGVLPGWANAWILLMEHLGTNHSEIIMEIHTFSFKKMHLKIPSWKCRPFCLGLNVITFCFTVIYFIANLTFGFNDSVLLACQNPVGWQTVIRGTPTPLFMAINIHNKTVFLKNLHGNLALQAISICIAIISDILVYYLNHSFYYSCQQYHFVLDKLRQLELYQNIKRYDITCLL